MRGMSQYTNYIDKWCRLGRPPIENPLKHILDKAGTCTPAAKILYIFEALKMGIIPHPEDGEFLVRAGLYNMVKDIIGYLDGEPSMTKVLADKNIGAVQRYFSDTLGDSNLSIRVHQAIRYAFHVRSFEMEGCRTYRVSAGLSDMLDSTILKGLNCEDVRLPYKAMSVEAPPVPKFKLWNVSSGWHDFEGAYIFEDYCSLPHDRQMYDSYEEIQAAIEPIRSMSVMFTGHSKKGAHPMDDAVFSFAIKLPDGVKLDDQVDLAANTFSLDKDNNNTPWRDIFRWLLNVVIYATWPDCEREHVWVDGNARKLWQRVQKASGKKRSKLAQRLKEMNQSKVIYLGGSIKLDRSTGGSDGIGRDGKPLSIRQKISGHWKNQACGEKRSKRKLIWVEPYWRGPEDGPIKLATYKLDSKTVRTDNELGNSPG